MIHRGAPGRPSHQRFASVGVLAAGLLLAADAAGPAFAPAFAATPAIDLRELTGAVPTATADGPVTGADAPAATAGERAGQLDLGTLALSDGDGGDPFAGAAAQPGIQYADALAHADDPNRFTPGGRVTVPFRPRASDGWVVDGHRPVALPAGRLSGQAMAAARSASGAVPDGPLPVDRPSGVPTVAASSATFEAESPLVTGRSVEPTAASGLRRQIFGFLPYWELGDSDTVLNYSLLSTIAYFSVGATKSGNLRKTTADGSATTGWAGWTSSAMTKVIDNAHSAGTRVVLTLSVFAWSSSEAAVQASILGSAANRLRLAQQTAAAVRDRGADGVNLDFEPIASGYADEFVAFVKALRSELDKIHKGYQITFDTTGYVGNYKVADLISAGADAMFLMGYDFRTSGSSPVGSIAPIAGPAYDVHDALDAFLARVPASRIILGVPYYGRAWSTTSSKLNATNQSGAEYGYSVAVNYVNAVDVLDQYGTSYDSLEQVAWTAYKKQNCTTAYGCVTSWRELYVDDPRALGAKYDLVNRLGLRGVGMWALGYDGTRPELYDTLRRKFLHDTTKPEAGIRILPTAATDEGFVVSWTGSDDVGITGYDVQVATDGGSWQTWKSGTTATSDVWLGTDGHTYAFRVRARDTSGNWSPWDVVQTGTGTPSLGRGAFGTVVADGLSLRTAPDTSATKLGTATSGDIYAITGGPVTADGYTWYEVTGPLSSWNTVGDTETGIWLAANGSGSTFVEARRAPNATAVDARLTGLGFDGLGRASLGAPDADRLFSPNGDGRRDTLQVTWTNETALDSLALKVFSTGGTALGSIGLSTHLGAGAQSYAWDGRVGGSALPDGRYVLQLVATDGGRTYTAPSARPVTAAQVDAYAVTIDRVADAGFTPITPVRVLDTRSGLGLSGTFTSHSPRTLRIAGTHGIPSDAIAVAVDVTVVNPTTGGRLSITRTPQRSPTPAIVYGPGRSKTSGGAVVPLSAGGLSITWVASTGSRAHVVMDVTGYFRSTGGSGFTGRGPTRVVNTKTGLGIAGPLASHRPKSVRIGGTNGIPSDAVAVTVDVTTIGPTSSGRLAVTPTSMSSPATATVFVAKGARRSSSTTVGLSGGRLSLVWLGTSGSHTNAIVDVTGYYRAGGAGYTRLGPSRLLNTSTGKLLSGPLPSRSPRTVTLAGRSGIPSDARAVTLVVSVRNPSSSGYVAVGPTATTWSSAAALYVGRGETRANGIVAPLGSGRLSIAWVGTSGSHANVTVEITGYIR